MLSRQGPIMYFPFDKRIVFHSKHLTLQTLDRDKNSEGNLESQ